RLNLEGAFVLDVGTGSGVLALVARRLGAVRAVGIDNGPDAILSARGNLALNPDVDSGGVGVRDLRKDAVAAADRVTANLTVAPLVAAAPALLDALRPGGALVVSGILRDERDGVVAAFAPAAIEWEHQEDEWVALTFRDLQSNR